MGSLANRNGRWKLTFYFQGRRRYVSLGNVPQEEAESKASQADYLLLRIRQGLLVIPPGVPIEDFILADGKIAQDVRRLVPIDLGALEERYLATHRNGAMEANSLKTVETHLGHVAKTLGKGFPLASIGLGDLQRHVDARLKAKYRGRPISPTTIRKELATLRAVWNWGERMGLVSGPLPVRGLVYPKTDEKPPFQTRAEIERRIAAGGISRVDEVAIWESLFLTLADIEDLLAVAKDRAAYPWIHPLLYFAAHTGARRSELIRLQVADIDFEGGSALIREKKRVRGKRTTRRVPLSPSLASVLREWLAIHPGGPHLFCQAGAVARSKKRSPTTGHKNGAARPTTLKGRMASVSPRESFGIAPLTRDEISHHLERTLAETRWGVVRGFHVLRHSFISNCAARGVDQRLIEAWAGHMTPETSRRYRHLIPSAESQAIRSVFT